MTTVLQQDGASLKNAIAWVSEQKELFPDKKNSKIVDEACIKFDLTPKDSEFLLRFWKEAELKR